MRSKTKVNWRTKIKIKRAFRFIAEFVEICRRVFVTYLIIGLTIYAIEQTGGEVPSIFLKTGMFFIYWLFGCMVWFEVKILLKMYKRMFKRFKNDRD